MMQADKVKLFSLCSFHMQRVSTMIDSYMSLFFSTTLLHKTSQYSDISDCTVGSHALNSVI